MSDVVVVPTLREAATIGEVVLGVRRACPDARVLVVDDASEDETAERAAAAGAEVMVRRGARGLGHAYRDGFARVLAQPGVRRVVQMDGDGSHDPDDVPRLLAALDDAELALGTRWVAGGGVVGWGLVRQVLSRTGTAWARGWLGLPLHDLTGGFKAWRAGLLRDVGLGSSTSEGYAFQVEATARAVRAGARVVEVPIRFTDRAAGRSKMNASIALEAGWRIPALAWARPPDPRVSPWAGQGTQPGDGST